MEHYFLYVCNGISVDEENFLIKYVKSLALSNQDIGFGLVFSTQLHNSTYLSKINLSSKLEKTIDWKKIISDLDVKNVICEKISEENHEKDNSYESSLVAEHINNLADQLPSCGSFKLDVIISEQIILNFDVNDHIELVASFHRLSTWHSAHTVFLMKEKSDNVLFKEWTELTNAEILKNDLSFNSGSLVWRGSIDFQHPNISTRCYEGFELKLDSNKYKSMDLLSPVSTNDNSEHTHLVLHPTLRAMDICNFISIPQHIILPVAFTLCSSSTSLNNDSTRLLQLLSTEEEAALIVRLGYSILNEKPKPNKSSSSSKWRKMAISGNVKNPDDYLPEVYDYLTLAVAKSPNSKDMVVYALKETSSLDAKFYFNAVNLSTMHSPPFSGSEIEKNDVELNSEMPLLSEELFQSHLWQIQNLNKDLNDTDFRSEIFSNTFLTSFVESITSSELPTLHLNRSLVNVSYEAVDPTDWPERVYLFHKQLQNEEDKKNVRSMFLNLSPQRLQYNVSLSSEDIKKYFSPSGEAKDGTKAEPVQLLSKVVNKLENFEEVRKKPWPEALKCTYGDIYYNINQQSEEKESIGNEMVRFFVLHETASTCNRQQDAPDAPISLHAKFLTPRKKPKSTKSATSLRQDMLKPNGKVKAKIFKTAGIHSNPVISTIMKTLGVKKSPDITNAKKDCQKRIPRKNSLPIRCSPRKKTSVSYYPSATNKQKAPSSASSQQSKKSPNDVDDISKKKLRVAIASALESNEINMTDPLFRPCFKKLFTICQTFFQDIPRKGSVSQYMQKIADAHVKQVVMFEKEKFDEK